MILLRGVRRVFKYSTSQTFPKFTQFELQQLLNQPNPLKEIIKSQLLHSNNEMKFSHYWDMCLTHPQHGFYSQKNVFSKEGHFTTSPEISSIFGEIIGVWIMHFVHSISKIYPDVKPNQNNTLNLRPFRLIQFGPGRGLLMADVLRCVSQLGGLQFLESVTMIETSAENSQVQQKNVLDELAKRDKHFGFLYNNTDGEVFRGENSKIQLRWFKNLFDMIRSEKEFERIKFISKNQTSPQLQTERKIPPFNIILAHQFFDALPTQSYIYTENGWRERVISLNSDDNLVLTPSSHPLNQKFIPLISDPEVGTTLQVSPQSLLLIQTLSQMIAQSNGCILNIDYGNAFSHSDSIRAIKSHKFVPYPYYLNLPGLCDLSAYVDFASLQQFAQKTEGIKAYGPIPQGLFLQSMGINPRIQVLSKGKNQEIKKRMQEDYERLVSPQKMGQIYKVQMITCKENQEVYPFITEDNQNVF